ncbi:MULTISPECIES: hypothetical protein [unclassified Nitratiruptor]|uniref:hypothetical protein n=1 Tax=unclassified Nitratiruptor TaxID=2624044 RepID=UPI001915EA6F|nr:MULTISPECIES: hypothetical protein [unclassified Nitratiruptor]BCD60818.1 hypothetical protein NitYY0810_C1596 [Nitratiruptor sp. YY08-10]BCD64750.1 hypothetical protein NitYY0814_C1604 [Nitratiruptor sp. YY08-14]
MILKIWWSWQWRVLVAVMLANILIDFLMGLFGGLLALSQKSVIIGTNLLSFSITIYASIYFLGFVMRKYRVYIPNEKLDVYKKAAIK